MPELDSSHAENHSTWALRTGGGQSEDDGGEAEGDAVEEQYEAVGGVDVVSSTERHESSGEALENNLVEEEVVVTEAEVAVSFEDQATLKIRQTPPPPLPPKRNGRRTVVEEDATESDGEGGAVGCAVMVTPCGCVLSQLSHEDFTQHISNIDWIPFNAFSCCGSQRYRNSSHKFSLRESRRGRKAEDNPA